MYRGMAPGTLEGKLRYGSSDAMIVVVKRDGFVCNMDFGPDTVAGTIAKLDPQKSRNCFKICSS